MPPGLFFLPLLVAVVFAVAGAYVMLSPFVMPARALALALYLSLSTVTAASIKVAHPAQGQLPLIARTSQPYSWTLRNDTFLPPPSKLVARELPDWLDFDAGTLTFSGVVPAAADIPEGPLAPITLVADDGKAKDTLVLYVSSLEPPVVARPIAGQLRPHAPPLASVFLLSPGSALASPTRGFERGLRVPPGWSFSIGWDGDTFVFPGGDDVFYAARLANGDPLPGWMTYDRYTMTFVGVAPNLPAPTVFDVVLYGGDASGYQAVHDSFALAVAAHELAWDPQPVDLGAPLFAGVMLDGEPLKEEDDKNAKYTVQTGVDWLSFNATTRALVGAPPAGYTGPPVVAHATVALGGQTVRADVPVNVPGLAMAATELAPLVVRPGADVSYDLGAGAHVAPGPLPGAPWLHADADGTHLTGTAPMDAGSVVASVPLLDPATGQPSAGAAKLNVTVSPTLPVSNPAAEHPADKDSKKLVGARGGINKAVLAACIGALLGFALLCTFAACCRKFCAVREDVRPGSPRVRDLEVGEKALDLERSISASSTISGKAAKVLGIGIESPPLPSFPSGKPALTAMEVKAQPTSSAKSAFFRRLRDWQERNGPMAPEMDVQRPDIRDAEDDVKEDEHPYEGVVELPHEGVEASPSGSTVTGRSAVSYDCTTDTSSTLSEPLEAEHETPRRRRDFGPGPSPAREHGSIIRTAARVTRAGEFIASAVREGTPELVSGVRLVSLSGVVDSAPRLAVGAVGRGVGNAPTLTPSPDPRMRAFGQMQLIEPHAAARESALSYLTTSSAAEDPDEDEDPAIAQARRALHMGRGAPLR